VLILGEGDVELEASFVLGSGSPVERSPNGSDVPPASYDVVAIGGEATADRRGRAALLEAAARAVKPRGVVAVEFPNCMAAFAPLLLAYEGLSEAPNGRGGVTYGGAREVLHEAGFKRVAGFMSLPSLADPRVLLPLDSSRALAFHFRAPFFAESPRRRLVRQGLGFLAGIGWLPALSPSYCMIAARGEAT
jgi:hypothetical protein